MISAWNAARRSERRGAVVVLAAVFVCILAAFVAFGVDVGYLCLVRTRAQNCADSAALAAAWAMVDDSRVMGTSNQAITEAREMAVQYAARHTVVGDSFQLDPNFSNAADGDVVLGRLDNPSDRDEPLSFPNPSQYNTVLVRVNCNSQHANLVPLSFARLLGCDSAEVKAEAAAVFEDRSTVGFHATEESGPSTLMPFVVHVEQWEEFLAQGKDDDWSYDPVSQSVSSGSDGKPEMRLYPMQEKGNHGGGGGTGITPGNFGKVDIGAHNNNRQDLFRQIREGVSAEDLAYYGGELRLDPVTKTLQLNGDMGITAGMQHALADIVGMPKTILLYSEVTGQGAQTWFTIVGFVGVRVVDFSMTGKDKYILIQPTMVVDRTAIAGDAGSSYFVGQPVRLVR